MAENSAISWTDHTFNCWWSCFELSPACDSCYARTLAARFGTEWGPDARLRFFEDAHWQEPVRWNRKAEKEGICRRVFCASMADILDLRPEAHPDYARMQSERHRLWELIEATPWLTWLLLTKRPKYARRLMPAAWFEGHWPANAWFGCTTENQEWADQRLPYLASVPAPVRFISAEPLLGPIILSGWDGKLRRNWLEAGHPRAVSWVIAGGESGHAARPTHPDWLRSLRSQCQEAGVAFHFKQHGEFGPSAVRMSTGEPTYRVFNNFEQWVGKAQTWLQPGDVCLDATGRMLHRGADWERARDEGTFPVTALRKVGKKAAGRLLDGRTWDEFPEVTA